jgi:hypothetical protein
MENREYGRVKMSLPVRMRWSAPLGQKIELGETIDVSRGGILVTAREFHTPGVSVWVTFPYDVSLADGQPEIPARVVRCDEVLEVIRANNARVKTQTESASKKELSAKLDQIARAIGFSDTPATYAVAFHFEEMPQASPDAAAKRHEPERRGSSRKSLAVAVRVHPARIPWAEEAMTIDISETGMRFRSHREYARGDHLKIMFEDPSSAPWQGPSEFSSTVVRVAPVPDSIALDISVCRM